jgi:protein O-mannosyl-transferase
MSRTEIPPGAPGGWVKSLSAQKVAVCLALAAVTLALYWPATHCGFICYDDTVYVTENHSVCQGLSWRSVGWAFQSTHGANWHPLTWLSHMLDVQLFGLNPRGHHLTNVLLHTANVLLLFLLLARMTRTLWPSALVAAGFAWHPLHVESVAWVAERKDVLSAFFGLLSLWFYACWVAQAQARKPAPENRSRQESRNRTGEAPGARWGLPFSLCSLPSGLYLLALLLFALSLMSKPMLVTLPLLLLLLDYWPLGRWQPGAAGWATARSLLLEKAPFLLLSALSSVVTLLVQQPAMTSYRHLPFWARPANAMVACVRYLGKTFWPQDLAVFYPYPLRWPAWEVVGSVLLVATLSAWALWGWRKRPYLLVGWFWFLGSLVPVLGLVQVGVQSMADRYTYLPLVGLFLLLVWAGAEALKALHLSARPGLAAALLGLVLCAALTRVQLRFWLNSETLFTHAIAVTQGNWVAHYNLALLTLRRYQESQHGPLEKQSLQLEAAPPSPLASAPAPPDYLETIILHCQAALQAQPGFADPYVTLAKALTEKGQLEEARAHLERAIRLDPKSAEAWQNLAEIDHRQGRAPEAIAGYQAALQLRADWPEVLNNLAWLLATHPSPQVRNGSEAVRLAERACALTGHTNFWFVQTLAAAYAEAGHFPQAVAAAQAARHLAAASGQVGLVTQAETRIELYQGRQAYRSP